jgi:hypothetical protein
MFSRVHKIRTLFVPETHPQREKSWSSSWTIYVRLKLLHPTWKMALRKQFLTFDIVKHKKLTKINVIWLALASFFNDIKQTSVVQ